MNHNLFRDLVPNYLENLTSQETNEEMLQHMTECKDCRYFFKAMQQGINETENSVNQKDAASIDVLKKVKLQQHRKVKKIVISLVTIFVFLMIGCYFLFVHMWFASAEDVQSTITHQGNNVTMTFASKNRHHYLMLINREMPKKGYENSLNMYEKMNDFSKANALLKKGTSVSYTFLNRNTLLLSSGKKYRITNKDIIHIKYRDKNQNIKLVDLYDSVLGEK